jgi:hypothetical protein
VSGVAKGKDKANIFWLVLHSGKRFSQVSSAWQAAPRLGKAA